MENRIDKDNLKRIVLKEILNRLDVPEMRKDISKKENLLWLQRNLLINNGANSLADKGLLLVGDLLELMS